MMGDLSKNFSRVEFACKCGCDFDTVDVELITKILQPMRDQLERPIHITPHGGCRCNVQNIASGGANNSLHKRGKAADIWVEGYSPKEIYTYLDERFPDKYGLGLYGSFVHVDCREKKARWKG